MGNESSSTMKQLSQQTTSKRRFLNPRQLRSNRAAKRECEFLGNELISLKNVHRNASFNNSNPNQQQKRDLIMKPTYLRCVSSF